jgi:hypothetical protein
LFFTEEMLDLLVKYTNQYIQDYLDKVNLSVEKLAKSPYIKLTDKVCILELDNLVPKVLGMYRYHQKAVVAVLHHNTQCCGSETIFFGSGSHFLPHFLDPDPDPT